MAKTKREPWLKLGHLRWLLVPLVVAGVTVLPARLLEPPAVDWYQAAAESPPPCSVLALGTSRTAAAISAREVSEAMDGSSDHVASLARAASRLQQHYLGLRRMLDGHPRCLEEVLVLVEAPGGVPEAVTWADPWHHPATRSLLVPLLRGRDMRRLWSEVSGIDHRVDLTADWLARGQEQLTRRSALRASLFSAGGDACDDLLGALIPRKPSRRRAGDVHKDAGVGQGEADMVRGQRLMAERVARAEADPKPAILWERSVFLDLVSLVRRAGGEVLLLPVPISPAEQRMAEILERRRERNAFPAFAASLGVTALAVDFQTVPEDFPDGIHLHSARRKSFSQVVGEALRKRFSVGAAPR